MTNKRALIEECVSQRVWAVVGFSADSRKYGNRIYFDLRQAGYQVYPINRKGGMVGGDRIYKSLADLPQKPAVVDIVVPPEETIGVVQECFQEQIERVWMQPGAECQEAIKYCRQNGIKVVDRACAMVEKRFWDR